MQRKGAEARGAAPSYRTLLEHPFKHQRLPSGLIGRLLHEGRRVRWFGLGLGEVGMECALGVLLCKARTSFTSAAIGLYPERSY